MKVRPLFVGVLLIAAQGWAAEERISPLLRSIADGGPVPVEKAFYDTVNESYVNQLSPDAVKEFLPLARKLLVDPRPEARRYGLMCFMVVTLRRALDSELLLDPYVTDLLVIADDRASPIRNMAGYVLGHTQPRISPKALEDTAAHLADKDNTPEEIGAMACALLKDGSDPLVRGLVGFLHSQSRPEGTVSVLACLRALPPTRNADILSFIGSSLDGPDASVRRAAVSEVARFPMEQRTPFLPQLSRMSNDPNEPAEVRSAAAQALRP
jgi:HEAT repeat protein